MKKKEIAVLQRIEEAERWRDSYYKDNWRSYIDLYRSKLPEKRDGSNLFVPYTFMTCEVVRTRLAESLFSSRPYVSLLPRNEGDADKAKAAQTLLDWQYTDRMKIESVFRKDAISDLVVLGTLVMYTGWSKKTRKIRRMEKVPTELVDENGPVLNLDGTPMMVDIRTEVDVEDVVYDDPVCQCIDLFDFFVDPNATDIENARYCGHKEYRTKSDLKQIYPKINWKGLEPVSQIESGRQIRMEDDDKTIPADDYSSGDDNGLYEVLQYWEDGRHCVIINRKQMVLDEPNPFWHGMKPYDKTVYTPLANSFYGAGIPQALESLQSELNTVRNQRIDYNSMALRRMWKVRKGSSLTAKDLVWRQNGIISLDNMDDVLQIPVSPLPASAFTNESVIKGDMRDTTGCHDIIMGLANTNETATTTMTKDNNASIRFKDVVNNLADDIMVPVSKKCISLDQQFMAEERMVRLLDAESNEIIFISPDDIAGEYDIIYVGSSVDPMANKELKQQRMVNIFNMLVANPLYQNDPEATKNLMRELLKAYDIEDVEGMLPTGGMNGQGNPMAAMAGGPQNGVLPGLPGQIE